MRGKQKIKSIKYRFSITERKSTRQQIAENLMKNLKFFYFCIVKETFEAAGVSMLHADIRASLHA